MTEIGLQKLWNKDQLRSLQGLVSEIFEMASGRRDLPRGFLGTMPMTLSRRSIPMIKHSDYVILEKSDGARYLMLVLERGVLLIDRRMNFYPVEPDPNILLPTTEPTRQDRTLLDGELTLNLITQQWEYLVYDTISINGDTSVAQLDYRQRLINAENFITFPRCFSSNASGSLRIRVKDFYEKNQIKDLFKKITKDDSGEYIYANGDRKDGPICNHNDGCIFAPVQMEYQIKTCHALLKWKPPHLNSVDFQLLLEQTGNGTIKTTIAYQGDHGPVKLREVMFPRAQKAEWAKNFQRVNGSIVECTYDRRAGEWRYIREREDKDRPNYSSTVIDTLESTAEEVLREELIAVLMSSPVNPELSKQKRLIYSEDRPDDLFCNLHEDYLRTLPISTVPVPVPMNPHHRGRSR
uniref:mRNA guanylyltransferase n=2 Tax=Rhodosorus marinus TaxID=101924 RepID=A0A7S3E9N2_9RHOD|mmetsp:Transcript_19254/g.77127  ORF Transcript_19254/g.77127 Transcript_19254/m.77127 type:complete len:408 (+) Transcript_19254:347-1570(+)